MKNHRRRSTGTGSVYPWSVLASVKGDDFACIRFMNARSMRTRRGRKASREMDQFIRSVLAEAPNGN